MTRTLLIPALALAVAACADNRSSIEIIGRAAPSDPASCKFAPGGEIQAGPGTLDVSAQLTGLQGYLSYALEVYLNNNLVDPSATNPGTLAASKAFRAATAKVRVNPQEYTDKYAPSPALLAFQGQNVLSLDGSTFDPNSKGVLHVEALSPALGAQIAAALPAGTSQRMVLGITVQGQTLDGASVESAEWYYPVDVCDGCLVAFDVQQCLASGAAVFANNCFAFGEDFRVTCSAAP